MIEVLVCVFLLLLMIQDWKERKVYVWTLICLLLVVAIKGLMVIPLFEWLSNWLINFFFLLFQYVAVVVFFSIKRKKIRLSSKYLIGLGDILFLLIVASTMSLPFFIHVYLGSLLLTLILYFFHSMITGKRLLRIPLITGLGLGFLCFYFVEYILQINSYQMTLL